MKLELQAFTIRVRTELIDWLTDEGEKNHRSRTGQVVALLEAAFTAAQPDLIEELGRTAGRVDSPSGPPSPHEFHC